jgi:hypothetical protein
MEVRVRMVSVLAATVAGAAAGWACGLVPIWPVARLIAASVFGALVGAVGVVLVAFISLSRSTGGGSGAVSFGLSEAVLVGVPAVILLLAVGYLSIRWWGWSPARLAPYGPVICGGGVALLVALWALRGITIAGSS